jgi:hypothetical protein
MSTAARLPSWSVHDCADDHNLVVGGDDDDDGCGGGGLGPATEASGRVEECVGWLQGGAESKMTSARVQIASARVHER